MLRHMPTLIAAAQSGNWLPDYSTAAVTQLWGDVTDPGHVFNAQAIDWGFNLTEPQCTKALAYFLGAEGDESLSRHRCAAFVRALYRAAGLSNHTGLLSLENVKPGTLILEAEKVVDRGRVDLALEWKDKERVNQASDRRLILIECKFNHHVTEDQLLIYRKHADRHAKGVPRALFLIVDQMTSQAARELRRSCNKEWIPLTWRALIRRLEIELMALGLPADQDFVRLRRTIWNMCTSRSL